MYTKKYSSISVLLYGLLLAILGYFGSKAGSKISQYLGVGFGSALIVSSLFMFWQKQWASKASLLLTTILTITFGIRSAMTGKTIPIVLFILSSGMLIFLFANYIKWKKR